MFRPTVTAVEGGSPIAPTVIGQGGRIPPNRIIDNDSTGDVDTNPIFDPQQDGIDFHESVEGMLLRFNDAVATGPSQQLRRGLDHRRQRPLRGPADASRRGDRPGNDFNPERFILDDVIGETPSTANVGDKFSHADRGRRRLLVRQLQVLPADRRDGDRRPPARGHRVAEVERARGRDVQRREPRAGRPAGQVRRAGADARSTTSSRRTSWPSRRSRTTTASPAAPPAPSPTPARPGTTLIAAIAAGGGPTYQYRQIDPVAHQDGGAPGGNIRQGFLYRTDRGLAFVEPAGRDVDQLEGSRPDAPRRATQVQPGPDRADQHGVHHQPQAAGRRVHVEGQDGHRDRQPLQLQGRRPAAVRAPPAARAGHGDPAAPAGEDRQRLRAATSSAPTCSTTPSCSGTSTTSSSRGRWRSCRASSSCDLYYLLPRERALLVRVRGQLAGARPHPRVDPRCCCRFPEYDSVHVDAEFADQQSDHDPQVARLRPN